MKLFNALALLFLIPSVLGEDTTDRAIVESIVAEVEAEAEATSSSSTVSNQVVYGITKTVVSYYSDEPEFKSVLGHITDAVAKLEKIHTGDSGAVSDIMTEVMHEAFGN